MPRDRTTKVLRCGAEGLNLHHDGDDDRSAFGALVDPLRQRAADMFLYRVGVTHRVDGDPFYRHLEFGAQFVEHAAGFGKIEDALAR